MKNTIKVLLILTAVLAVFSIFISGGLQQIIICCAALLALLSFVMLMAEPEKAPEKIYIKETVKAVPLNNNVSAINLGNKEFCFDREALNKEKISVLNKFASVASHDIKNPLSSLKNIAYYFTNSVKIEGEVQNKMLRMLESEVNRMNDMIVDLLDTTRIKQLNPAVASLDIIISEVVESEKGDNIFFETNLKNLQASVDTERFKQVIKSIIKNSKDAMAPNGGTISIKLLSVGTYAIIEISDTGKGMDKETLEKCFDPMFSTKQAKALGMSLTVSKQIINMLSGNIKAESALGRGSVFTIQLPLEG